MKLTMTHRGRGSTAALAEGQDIASCPRHLNRDGTLSIALAGSGGHVYTLSGTREEWFALFCTVEDLYDTAEAGELGGGLTPEQIDALATDGLAGTLTGIFADPTPRLTAEVIEDMKKSALDMFRKSGVCHSRHLVQLYCFTENQVRAHGDEAITQARLQWERENGAAGAAPGERATA